VQSGTDDHAIKNVSAAREAGVGVAEFVAANGERFAALATALEICIDEFVRTSRDPRHAAAVTALWRACQQAGDLYTKDYTGLYCPGCEQFYGPDELVDGACAEHGTPVVEVTETNWFFRLSRYREQITELITSGRLDIIPGERRNEVLGFLAGEVHDVSVSRPGARAGGWGIRVPGDPEQVVYVWFDALTNYLTGLGYGTPDDAAYRRWWAGDAERVHVIGKGIVRFHAIYWPAILASAGLPWPTAVFVHDYLTVDGVKISKSAGNGIDPAALAARNGRDAVRWWLLRESPAGVDADFSHDRFVAVVNGDLAHGYGNLVTRVAALVRRNRPELLAGVPGDDRVARAVLAALDRFDLRAATRCVVEAITDANRALEATRPWELARDDPRNPRIDDALRDALARSRAITTAIAPFVPATASAGAARLEGAATREPVFAAIA
jgi:methionyl-tRNA synthetase